MSNSNGSADDSANSGPQLFPTILTDSLTVFGEQLELVKQNGHLEVVQVDIIDGYFVDNLTVEPQDIIGFDFGELGIDFHLQTEEPLDFVYEIVDVADNLPVRGIIAQVERMTYQNQYIEEVKKHGWQVGLCLDFYTPVNAIDEQSWFDLDVIQLMGNQAGFQGNALDERIFTKIKELRRELETRQLDTAIFIDVGVKNDNAQKLIKAGVTGLSVGSALWRSDNFDKAVDEFRSLLG